MYSELFALLWGERLYPTDVTLHTVGAYMVKVGLDHLDVDSRLKAIRLYGVFYTRRVAFDVATDLWFSNVSTRSFDWGKTAKSLRIPQRLTGLLEKFVLFYLDDFSGIY